MIFHGQLFYSSLDLVVRLGHSQYTMWIIVHVGRDKISIIWTALATDMDSP
jgi:hypothetical protein